MKHGKKAARRLLSLILAALLLPSVSVSAASAAVDPADP